MTKRSHRSKFLSCSKGRKDWEDPFCCMVFFSAASWYPEVPSSVDESKSPEHWDNLWKIDFEMGGTFFFKHSPKLNYRFHPRFLQLMRLCKQSSEVLGGQKIKSSGHKRTKIKLPQNGTYLFQNPMKSSLLFCFGLVFCTEVACFLWLFVLHHFEK